MTEISQAHRPMTDCGHCWAGRNGLADRDGDWRVVICEECDQSWPCPESSDSAATNSGLAKGSDEGL